MLWFLAESQGLPRSETRSLWLTGYGSPSARLGYYAVTRRRRPVGTVRLRTQKGKKSRTTASFGPAAGVRTIRLSQSPSVSTVCLVYRRSAPALPDVTDTNKHAAVNEVRAVADLSQAPHHIAGQESPGNAARPANQINNQAKACEFLARKAHRSVQRAAYPKFAIGTSNW